MSLHHRDPAWGPCAECDEGSVGTVPVIAGLDTLSERDIPCDTCNGTGHIGNPAEDRAITTQLFTAHPDGLGWYWWTRHDLVSGPETLGWNGPFDTEAEAVRAGRCALWDVTLRQVGNRWVIATIGGKMKPGRGVYPDPDAALAAAIKELR